ncbi:MAG: alpha/beta fold hydrolase [Candidatus Omnitrophota bacterium]
MISTRDNISIAYDQYKNGSDSVVVICPGYYTSKANRWIKRTAELVSPVYDVIAFDFRGHGQSEGRFTWSAKESMDVDAIVDLAKAEGYKHIGIVAFSLGAASAINAAAGRTDIESMVLISCPIRFRNVDFHFWEPEMFIELKDDILNKWQGKGARTANIFMHKKDPIDTVRQIDHTAILFIHGDRDWLIKDRHSKKLFDAANPPKEIETIRGGLHAERLVQFYPDKMKELILNWFSKTLKKGPYEK